MDEFVFRYNNRTIDNRDRFRLMWTNIEARHLSYEDLIAIYSKVEQEKKHKEMPENKLGLTFMKTVRLQGIKRKKKIRRNREYLLIL